MPNYCNYEMHVYGKKKDIRTLYDYLRADYYYRDDGTIIEVKEDDITRPVEHHIGYRVFSANTDYFKDEDVKKMSDDEDGCCAYIFGDCAWSVHSCMLRNEEDDGNDIVGTYIDRNRIENKADKSLSIVEASKLLNLDIEIYSEECGMCFTKTPLRIKPFEK